MEESVHEGSLSASRREPSHGRGHRKRDAGGFRRALAVVSRPNGCFGPFFPPAPNKVDRKGATDERKGASPPRPRWRDPSVIPGTVFATAPAMKSENSESFANGSADSSAKPKHKKIRIDPNEIARRAKALVAEWPAQFDAQTKRNPYAAVGIAFAVGAGAGIVLSSRVLRMVLASGLTYLASEIGKTYLRQTLGDFEKATTTHASA
jgi:hypothetical protein